MMEPNTLDLISEAKRLVQEFNYPELQEAGLIPLDGLLYFPSIYYPPIPMYGPSSEREMLDNLALDAGRPVSMYFHIPFCRSRCRYCHWVVHTGQSEQVIDHYLTALEKEVILWKRRYGVDTFMPHSILIGGGTPTAISPAQTRRLYEIIHTHLDLKHCAQMTCETEPGTLLGDEGATRLQIMKESGVERISLGVQSFDDKALKQMGRAHSAADAIHAIEAVRKAGFDSLAIDLIYGYPGSTPEKWLATLQTTLEVNVDAFQLYRLRIVPHGDRVGEVKPRFDRRPEEFPGFEDIYTMKQLGFMMAEKGGLREASRRLFSKGPAHSSAYLKDHCDRLMDVVGFGISSWSNVKGRFFLNTGESLAKYASSLDEGRIPINRGRVRSPDDEQRWAAVLALKHNGLAKGLFRNLTGEGVEKVFPRQICLLKKYGLIEETDRAVRLTARGVFFADEVVIQFYNSKFLPFPREAYSDGELNPHSYF